MLSRRARSSSSSASCPVRDHVAVTHRMGGLGVQRFRQPFSDVGGHPALRPKFRQQGCVAGCEQLDHPIDRRQRVAQRRKFTRPHGSQRDARADAFEVGQPAQRVAQAVVQRRPIEQGRDRTMPCARHLATLQRVVQPVAQATAAHAGLAVIQQAKQGRSVLSAQRFGDFQIAAGHGVEQQEVRRRFAMERGHVRQSSALRGPRIVEQCRRRREDFGCVRHCERIERGDLKQLLQGLRAPDGVEVPVRPGLGDGTGAAHGRAECVGPGVGHQHFGRSNARELGRQERRSDRRCAQFTGRQHEPGKSERPAALQWRRHRQQRSIGLVLQQPGVGQCARRDDAHDLAFDRPFAGGGIADLFTDRHAFAHPDQAREVLLDRHHRHAGHFHRRTGRSAARSQRDVEQACSALGVVVEQLVEVAHPVEQQHVRMVRLDAQVLRHHGRVLLAVCARRHVVG